MSKAGALLLIVIGLGVGLWLGFDPTAHKETIQNWDKARAVFVQVKSGTGTNIDSWDTHLTTWFRSSPRPQPAPLSQPSASVGSKQISTALQTFWHSVQRIWLSILAKLRTAKS